MHVFHNLPYELQKRLITNTTNTIILKRNNNVIPKPVWSPDLRGFFQFSDDHRFHAVGTRLRTGAVNWDALSVDEEFRVVPLDLTAEKKKQIKNRTS